MVKFFLKIWYLTRDLLIKPQKAETLVEVIIAILVVSMGAATATSLVVTALGSNLYNKDTLVATNLAIEGIETVRNVRDTNWLKFSFDAEHCWNIRPEQASCNNKIVGGFYSLGKDLSAKIDNDLDLKNGSSINNDLFKLKYFDLNVNANDPKSDSDGDANKNNDKDFIGSNYAGATEVGNIKFFRSIQIIYSDINGNAADENNGQIIKITSKVQWIAQGLVKEIVLNSNLTNYRQ